jgi:CubicO group peptidase (beta-lactamase class C family)
VFNGVTFKLLPANREPNIQDLLRHTSGITYGELTKNTLVREAYIKAGVFKPDLDYDARELKGSDMADGIGKAPLAQQPGTAWEYSLSVDVQGRVVEAVTGQRLNDFMAQRIFKPLKMADTGFHVPSEKSARLAISQRSSNWSGKQIIGCQQSPWK